MKLIIIRGVSGSGKSTLARMLGGIAEVNWFEADMFMETSSQAKRAWGFAVEKLQDAHRWCRNGVYLAMCRNEPLVIVSNTFTRHWEYQDYVNYAGELGYSVQTIICQGRFKNIHGVPDHIVKAMEERFEI
jgi:predicted kinase